MTTLRRVFEKMRRALPGSRSRRAAVDDAASALNRNVGENLLEWPQRSEAAVRMLSAHVKEPDLRLADYGCGRQTLRRLIPASWRYAPFDWQARSDDTVTCDFNRDLPESRFDVIVCLGVLEYLDEPLRLLSHALQHGRYVVLSYNGPTTETRRRAQGWRNSLELTTLEGSIAEHGARVVEKRLVGENEWLYLLKAAPVR